GVNFGMTALLSKTSYNPAPNPYLPDSAPTSPQVEVDYETGNVYILWLDWTTKRIYALRSGPDAMWFTLLPSIDAGMLLGPLPGNDKLSGTGYQIEARSMLNARYNGVAYGGARYI